MPLKFFKSALSPVLVVLFLFSFSGCKESNKIESIDPAFAGYVSAFTSGIISRQDDISIRLADDYEDAQPGKKVDQKLFQFRPKIKGEAIWQDKRTILFQPTDALSSGKLYEAEFHLDELLDVPKQLAILVFPFRVIKQSVFVTFEGMNAYDNESLQWQQFQLTATTGDFAESENLEKAFEIFQNGNPLKAKWEHSPNGREHQLVIDSVQRGKDRSELFVKWKGSKINIENDGEAKFRIPPLGEFRVVNVKVVNHPQQSITVHFSDPLKKDLNINGLIDLVPTSSFKIVKSSNSVTLYPNQRLVGARELRVTDGVRNSLGYQLTEAHNQTIEFNNLNPSVELLGDGVILPNSQGLHFPFRAVNLHAVNVKVIKIFEKNIGQFLQANHLDGDRELKRVGRIVYKGAVPLKSDKSVDFGNWNSFSIDLSKFIQVEPGAIYRVSLSFNKSQSLYPCENETEDDDNDIDYPLPDPEEESYNGPSRHSYYYYDDYYEYAEGFNYRDRDNPCTDSYYLWSRRTVSRNVLASNLGIIAKGGNGSKLLVAVTDLNSTLPLGGVDVEVYNYQNKVQATSKTDNQGFVEIDLKKKPFLLVAKQGTQRGYLRLDDGSSLSLSMFDVGGKRSTNGVKGFIYGERGVWRPGDTLNLSFILQDKNLSIPENHPILVDLVTPQGQLYQRKVISESLNGFYAIQQITEADAPTGNWSLKVKVGASVFKKRLRIEAVKPNRLKIDLDFKKDILGSNFANIGDLTVKWLHGADAPYLKADIERKLTVHSAQFSGYDNYQFEDPSKTFNQAESMIFEGKLDPLGKAKVYPKIDIKDAPGMLMAQFKVRAFEKSGNFSIDRLNIPYSPYRSYVGVKVPEGKGWNGALFSDEPNIISIATVDEFGKSVNKSNLKVEIFNIGWRWWWDRSRGDDLAQFVRNSTQNLIKSDVVNTKNGKALYELTFDEHSYGRKFIRITDPSTGHSCGKSFYVTYKGWWNDDGSDNPAGAEMLTFSTDKKDYRIGEKVKVKLPATSEGRALVSIESGSKILRHFWIQASKTQSTFDIPVTEEMVPNAFISISLIQPHGDVKNDLPIRLYGIQSVNVENSSLKLEPTIDCAAEFKPEKKYTIKVAEKNSRSMTYTLAVVDEGLLDLTRFKTPNPNDEFYAKEALGIRTWDMYKYVLGARSAAIAGLLAIGGDDYIENEDATAANRFKPVVQYLGPFELKSGKSATHTLEMPNYIGAVRVMVVAGYKGSFGNAQKSVPVRTPLMVNATLPRVVGPGEKVKLPINVFALKDNVRNVKVGVKVEGGIKIIGEQTKSIRFNKIGDQIVEFDLETPKRLGVNKIKVWATSGTEKSTYEIEIQTRASNPRVTALHTERIDAGQTWNGEYKFNGMLGTNEGSVEFSRMPPLHLGKRLQYLIRYPHGCIEQTTSSVFPQLYLDKLVPLTEAEKGEIENNVKAAINKLKRFQLANGGMTYWPGSNDPSAWGTTYAGHFLIEAQARGYVVPKTMLNNWKQYQTNAANRWRQSSSSDKHAHATEHQQAYRLYTLALAKNPALGAMNRLRQKSNISVTARWRLAAAYQLIGKSHIAKSITSGLSKTPASNRYYYWTYGSLDRNSAVILESLSKMNRRSEAEDLYASIGNALRSNKWYSTQSTAFMLIAISEYLDAGVISNKLSFSATVQGKKISAVSGKSMQKSALNSRASSVPIQVKNTGSGAMYIHTHLSGIPATDAAISESNNLRLDHTYRDLAGNRIDPAKITQGTDFRLHVTVRHPGNKDRYQNLALTQVFPSGWEIRNIRMDSESGTVKHSNWDYQDIRDDRVMTYFSLGKNKTKSFVFTLHAAYKGKFYLPSSSCEAMYDDQISAIQPGKWVEVVD